MHIFLNRFYWFGEVELCTLGFNKGGPSLLGKHIFLNRFYWFGVVGLHTLGTQLAGAYLFSQSGFTGLV